MLVVTLLILVLLSLCIGFYQIVKQLGRILLRLDELERNHLAAGQPDPDGLAVGAIFPSFSLPDQTGKKVGIEDFRGKRVLLVHWSPSCGFCELIAPELARLQADFAGRDLEVLLMAQGESKANLDLAREHGLQCPILLLEGSLPPAPFKNMGTPAAYLLDGEGRVARPLAVGSEQIPALTKQIADELSGNQPAPQDQARHRPLSESRIVRGGLKAGVRAPLFRLPDIYGGNVSLEDYRGRRVLLVFSDPHCGPCDDLAPRLAELHKEHRENGLAFIMVGRGEPEENRRKAEQHGIRFPVVVQDKWKLSKEYGIFASPVAFLLREDGVILEDVAIGPTAILAMAQAGLSKSSGGDREYALSS